MRFAIQLVENKPNNIDAWHLLVSLHARTGSMDEIIRCCNEVRRLDPGYGGTLYNLALAL